jgi:hypothetical protein
VSGFPFKVIRLVAGVDAAYEHFPTPNTVEDYFKSWRGFPMRTVLVVSIASLFVCVPAEAQVGRQMRAAPPEPGLECFAQLSMPQYPPEALREDVSGTVWTNVKLTPQDTVADIDTRVVSAWSDGTKLLDPAVEKAIRASTFKPDCAGKTVFVAFRYELDGQAVANPQPATRKDPPNVVWIESQPPLMAAAAHHVTARHH